MNEPSGFINGLKQTFTRLLSEKDAITAKACWSISRRALKKAGSAAWMPGSPISRGLMYGAAGAAGAGYSYATGDDHMLRDAGTAMGVLGVGLFGRSLYKNKGLRTDIGLFNKNVLGNSDIGAKANSFIRDAAQTFKARGYMNEAQAAASAKRAAEVNWFNSGRTI